jgi:hypothetical protein
MINKSTFFVLVAILAACSNNFVSNDYLKDTRIPLAKTLEDEKSMPKPLSN